MLTNWRCRKRVTDVRFGHTLETFLDGFESTHPNWGRVVGFAKENVALCKPHWLEHEDGEVSVPVAEHGSDFESDFVVPMWTHNAGDSEVNHTDFGKFVAAFLLQRSDQ